MMTISGQQIKPHDNLKLAEDHTGLYGKEQLKFAPWYRIIWKPHDMTTVCIWKTGSNGSRSCGIIGLSEKLIPVI